MNVKWIAMLTFILGSVRTIVFFSTWQKNIVVHSGMKIAACLFFLFCGLRAFPQLPPSPDSLFLLSLNQRIDDLVVQQKLVSLDSLYAEDFVFSHGSGRIEGKPGWMRTAGRTKYAVRRHDSVRVQQHGDVAVVRGAMYIERLDKDKTARYRLRYIRVFAMRSRWQLISHTTVEELHL